MTAPVAWVDRLAADVPVAPDADTARAWARGELARPEYAGHGPTLLERFLDWLSGLGAGTGGADLPDALPVALVVLVLAAVLLAFWSTGRVRASTRARAAAVVLEDDARTSEEIRASADRAAARGDWAEAVLERYRAVVRALEERAVLDDRPGRTAHEVAQEAAARLPGSADELARAGRLFDDVRYGDHAVGPAEDAAVRALDAAVAGERPRAAPAGGRP
ncbi:DUF4129 domain-containing protein [Cellulomonas sp. PhB143]|uniref:DUF4129 domain-containing protein n=1 Tax=Cellulomonas sp. PhB143 TaxID=2485186 RepID=UPI000F468347|nr:DUF4129 domain-containing protein [Cellulomonas sp. PhB143]ROS78520.1 uncharacterized protein DUF4129 [Cellulomonas sp. PhB143]